MPTPTFINLVGADPAGTVLSNLTTGSAAVKTAISATLNPALQTQLSSALVNTPVLASLSAKITLAPADLVAANDLTLQAFLKQQLDPVVAKDPAMQQAIDGEIAKLTLTGSIGTLLQLNQPLQSHPLFQVDVNKANIETLLITSPTLKGNQQVQVDFITAYAGFKGPIQTFWTQLPSVNSEFTPAVMSELQLTLQLGDLTSNNVVLIGALRSTYTLSKLRDLTQLDTTQLTQLITSNQAPVPPNIPGSTSAERASNYASSMLRQLEAAFPTDYVAKGLKTSSDTTNQNVAAILGNAPDLDLRTTNIDAYLAANAEAAFKGIPQLQQKTVTNRLKAVQRVFRVNSDVGTIQSLLNSGLDSARKIAATPRALFLRQHANSLGGPSAALQVHSAAQRLSGLVSHLYRSVGEGLKGRNPYVIGSPTESVQQILTSNISNWQTLFGSTSSCQCDECSALDGPAAYFVDLLQFIGGVIPSPANGTVGAAGYSPLDVLIGYQNNPNNVDWSLTPKKIKQAPDGTPPLGRRPDLAYLNLTCANSDTSLPYVDLVNEILESYVYYVGMMKQGNVRPQSYNTPPDATTNTLNANPDNTLAPVYSASGPLATASYPFCLPYDRYVDTARLYLNNLGVTRAQLIGCFTPPSSKVDVQAELAVEMLNSTPIEYGLISGLTFTRTPYPFPPIYTEYGYAGASWPGPTLVVTATLSPANAAWTVVPVGTGGTPPLLISGSPAIGDSVTLVVEVDNVPGSPVSFTYTAGRGDTPSTIAAALVTLINGNITLQTAGVSAWRGGSQITFVSGTESMDRNLSIVETLLERTSLTMEDLVALLETRCLNADQTILLQADPNNPCDMTTMLIAGPKGGSAQPSTSSQPGGGSSASSQPAGTGQGTVGAAQPPLTIFLSKLPAFLRLKRRLGWSIADLDKAIQAVDLLAPVTSGSSQTGRSFVLAATQIKTLQGVFNLTVPQLLSLWTTLDADGRDSLYVQLFQNKAVLSPLDSVFALRYQASLPALPSPSLPTTWSDGTPTTQVSWASGVLYFTGTMTEGQQDDLLTWANGDSPTLLAIDNLYNQRWTSGTDIVPPAGQSQPLICDHMNTILAALRVSAADLSAMATEGGLTLPGADLSAAASAVIRRTVTVGSVVTLTMTSTTQGVASSVTVSYTVKQGDALSSIAAALAAAVNANTPLQTAGISASAQAALINLYVPSVQGTSVTWAGPSTFASGAEIVAITYGPPLNIANLSLLYRYALLAQALNLSVVDLITLKALIGINPFVAGKGGGAAASIPFVPSGELPDAPTNPMVQFIHASQAVAASNFSIEELNYLYRAIPDKADGWPPLLANQEQLLVTLAAGLQKIAASNVFAPDPKGTALRKKLAAILPADAVDPTMGLIDGTAIYTSSLGGLPAGPTPPSTLGQAVSFLTTATIGVITPGDPVTPGDSVSLSVTVAGSSVSLSYPVGDTQGSIAASLAAQITNNSTLQAAGITASANGSSVNLTVPATLSPPPACTGGASNPSGSTVTEEVTVGVTPTGIQVTLGGNSVTPGDIVTLSIALSGVAGSPVNLAHTVVGDTPSSIAAGLAVLINNSSALRTQGISATAASAVITISSPPSCPAYPSWAGSSNPASNVGSGKETVGIAIALECVGPMSDATKTALLKFSTDTHFVTSVNNLYTQAQNILSQNLDFLDANQAQSALIDTSSSAAVRYNYVLQSLLSDLQGTQSHSLVKQSLSQSLNLDPSLVALLLTGDSSTSTPALLPSQTLSKEPSQPAMSDLLGGLWGAYYSDPSLQTALRTEIDPGVNLDGSEATFGSAQWFGQIRPPTSDTYTFYVPTAPSGGKVQLWVNGQWLIDTVNPPATPALTPTISLQAGKLYDLQLTYVNAPALATAQIQLQWSNGSMSQATIPPTACVLGAAPSSAAGAMSSATFARGGAYSTLSLLNRIALLVNGFSMTADEVAYLSAHPSDFSGSDPANSLLTMPFNLSALPLDDDPTSSNPGDANPNQSTLDQNAPAWFNQWQRLVSLYTLKHTFSSRGNVGLFDIFEAASQSLPPGNVSPPVSQPVVNTLLQATGWGKADLKTLIGFAGFNLADVRFINEISLVQLSACMALVNRLGISSLQLFEWANHAPDANQAQDIQTTVKSKYDDPTWAQLGPSLSNQVREHSKDALIAYILNMAPIVNAGFTTADDLYDYFLIDVKMCTCMQTSRLVQATAAVQQFVQRCLLNLEYVSANPNNDLNVPPSSIDAKEWENWRKNYRVWQAAVEVFLFPENWIDPTLRDDRTPFFLNLQNQLLQTSITADNVEAAYLNYLDQLHQVARLEIVGLYVETATDPVTNDQIPFKTHVIGRTYGQPYVYYYRYLDQFSGQYVWSAWETIDLDVKDAAVFPVVLNGRLYLFWPSFTQSTISTTQDPNLLYYLQQIDNYYNTTFLTSKSPGAQPSTAFSTYIQTILANDPTNPILRALHDQISKVTIDWDHNTSATADSAVTADIATFQNTLQSAVASFNPNASSGGNSSSLPPTQAMQIQFAWSEYRAGQWTKKKVSESLSLPYMTCFHQLTADQFNWQFTDNTNVGLITPDEACSLFIQFGDTPQSALTYALPTFANDFLFSANVNNDSTVTITVYCIYKGIYAGSSASSYSLDVNPNQLVIAQFSFDCTVVRAVPNTSKPTPWLTNCLADDNTVDVSISPLAICNIPGPFGAPVPLLGHIPLPQALLTQTLQPPTYYYKISTPTNFVGWPGSDVAVPLFLGSQIFCADAVRTYFVSWGSASGNPLSDPASAQPSESSEALNASTSVGDRHTSPLWTKSGGQAQDYGVLFESHFHPWVNNFIEILNSGDIPGLLDISTQGLAPWLDPVQSVLNPQLDFPSTYDPNTQVVVPPYPQDVVDTSALGAYSIYNWELFFHIPFLIATQLSQNQQFEDAQTWFHYIFNPTSDVTVDSSGNPIPAPNRYWNFLFYRQNTQDGQIQDLVNALAEPPGPAPSEEYSQVAQWQLNPFDPDLIARLRPVAYQKAVVMAYIDNLIAWGDNLFGQNTRESINEATQLYVLANKILGQKPVTVPKQGVVQAQAYFDLQWAGLDNAMVQLENAFPFALSVASVANSASTSSLPNSIGTASSGTVPYFCTPTNTQLLGYWDTVADRLYKIRHCMNIQGQVQQLPLFAPPINPALLVAAEEAGVDLSSALSDINAAVPYYRFTYMVSRAQELCGEVKSLGSALLSALEKKDGEALGILRAGQEVAVQNAVLTIKQAQVTEATSTVQGLQQSLAVTQYRQSYYQGLINSGWSTYETAQVAALTTSQGFKTASQLAEVQASMLSLIPDFDVGVSGISSPVSTFTLGGTQLSAMEGAVARTFDAMADAFSFLATMAGLTGGWNRRAQEWTFQLQTATLEMARINLEIAAAQIRLQISQQDVQNQQLLMSNAQAVQDFLTSKFTNEDLYSWMIDQVSALYFQCYQMAYDLAKRAESCYRFELGLANSSYIQFGYWDSLKQGLLSGEKLYLDLKRLEMAYTDQNKREYEITRNISLVLLDPIALITLKETGRCIVSLPEAFFDMDYPGHYMRRIKSVSLTIPCVTGPYTSVNCTLMLVQSKIRGDATTPSGYAETPVGTDPRYLYNFAATQAVATSTAQNDSGMFEVNFRDERYLPFEGAGAVSQWQITMPQDCNAFDFETITDVILNLKYTSRDGGAAFGALARAAATLPGPQSQAVPSAPLGSFSQKQTNLTRFFSLKHEFPTEWHQFLNPTSPTSLGQVMTVLLTRERFPFQYRGKQIRVNQVDAFLKFRNTYPAQLNQSSSPPASPLADYQSGALLTFSVTPPGGSNTPTPPSPFGCDSSFQNMPHATVSNLSVQSSVTPWQMMISNIGAVAPSLWVTVPPNAAAGSTTTQILNAALVEDLFLVCHYSIQ